MSAASSLTIFLATLAVLAFVMTAAGFVALVWRVSWGVHGFVDAENRRADTESEIVVMLKDFVSTQRETNEQLWTAIQVHADRVNRLVEAKEGNS